MFVCLCTGATSDSSRGQSPMAPARTSKQVAALCGAASQCGRCCPTVRAIIAAHGPGHPPSRTAVTATAV